MKQVKCYTNKKCDFLFLIMGILIYLTISNDKFVFF